MVYYRCKDYVDKKEGLMEKPQKQTINEKIYIEFYNDGKSDLELAKLFSTKVKKVSERTIQRYGAKLRLANKIKPRKELPSSKTTSTEPTYTKDIKPIDWKIKKTTLKSSSKKTPFTTYLVIADTHSPYENEPAVKSILNLMDDIKFDGFLIVGDYMDMSPISHWLKNKRRTLENKRMKDDFIAGNKLLDEFDKRLPKGCDKRFWYGNHEDWYFQLVEEYPALEGLLEPKTELKLEERGYKVYDKFNHIERIGRLNITHGMYHSMHYVKTHIDKLKTNVLFGHLHSPRQRFESSPAREIAIAGYALGCLCDLAPDFMKNRANAWVHGFAVVYFYESGYFDVDLKRIVKGKFIFNKKLYDGNK